MAQWIKTDGTIEQIVDHEFTLEELNNFVGGFIEIVYLSKTRLMVVNEEGKLMGLPSNIQATLLAHESIVGNVLVCDSKWIK